MPAIASQAWLTPLLCAALSAGAVLALARIAPACGLVDRPGGRKTHVTAVPVVGGLAIFATLLAACIAMGLLPGEATPFVAALAIVVGVGAWDDVHGLAPRMKIAVQVVACGVMVWGAEVQLRSVGDLLGWRPIGLSVLTLPLTAFAVVGVVNAINMIDGLDGLGGSVAFIALLWYAAVAAGSGLENQQLIALALAGGVAGFLAFNLRFPGRSHARAFLGDAGSLMLGFALGWFAIDLTQGPGRTFPPIAALWVLLLPLADCVSLMARRLRAGRSPFAADRRHIHHYLLERGFSHGQVLAILVAASAAFGAVGYLAWRMDIPEPALFWPFFFGYFAYHAWIKRAWRVLEAAAPRPRLDEEPARVS